MIQRGTGNFRFLISYTLTRCENFLDCGLNFSQCIALFRAFSSPRKHNIKEIKKKVQEI